VAGGMRFADTSLVGGVSERQLPHCR
jgi:hypothetical protein